jgi:hypothetical protein
MISLNILESQKSDEELGWLAFALDLIGYSLSALQWYFLSWGTIAAFLPLFDKTTNEELKRLGADLTSPGAIIFSILFSVGLAFLCRRLSKGIIAREKSILLQSSILIFVTGIVAGCSMAMLAIIPEDQLQKQLKLGSNYTMPVMFIGQSLLWLSASIVLLVAYKRLSKKI